MSQIRTKRNPLHYDDTIPMPREHIPERALALAVIYDAVSLVRGETRFYKGSQQDKHEAWLFLFSPEEGWAWSREIWCQLCGIEPQSLKKYAKENYGQVERRLQHAPASICSSIGEDQGLQERSSEAEPEGLEGRWLAV